jgi:hypothetical protein
MAHVLEHLLAVDELEAAIGERQRDAVEGLEPRVAPGTVARLGGTRDVDAGPLHVRVARAEHVDRAAGPTTQIEHAPRGAFRAADRDVSVVVRERLAGVIAGHGIAQQVLEVPTGQPQAREPFAA